MRMIIDLKTLKTNNTKGFYLPVFLVPKKNISEMRMIIDLKTLNKRYLVPPPKFSDGVHTEIKVNVGDRRLAYQPRPTICLSSRPSHRKYLHFAINGRRYEFQVLPFGIAIAPWLFTRITAPVIKFAYIQLVRIHGYLDDFLAADQEKAKLCLNMIFLVQLMTYLGFLVKPSKSETTPVQDIIYIGARFQLDRGYLCPPPDRFIKTIKMIQSLSSQLSKMLRCWMSLLGNLSSLQDIAFGGRLMLRPLQTWNNPIRSYGLEFQTQLTPRLLRDLHWWNHGEHVMSGIPLTYPMPEHHLFTDASDSAWTISQHRDRGIQERRTFMSTAGK
ncbi:uncharacterized protein LOC124146171 [Haliotis rufescens]|uniref:uncharacterized protein LOC124146171 n=1 Tax=Haliotis rufescens TaxID=6454 RepID=UPI001EAFEB76|nr:uncharacterized protein LOC124146171 [Haliotis rufescens]